MNEMAETNKLLKEAVRSTYKKLTSIPKQYPKKIPTNLKTSKKIQKTVTFVENLTKGNKDTNKILKGKNVKNSSMKTTPNSNKISEIQASD